MATGGEKVHGQRSAEAFSRLRNDHEQFLEAYEKPTQIYRFLKARHTLKPLFLHRNLLYMHHPHHSRGKRRRRRRKLRVNDLINYTQENKPDLASEIKSDNHLRISFSGLEKGVDYQGLLATASSESTDQEPSLKTHDNHLMEVEVLLCRFSQLSMEAVMVSPKSLPCSCSSLGKFVLECGVSKSSNLGAKEDVSTKSGVTLSIPESRLIWKGKDRTTGTQTLIFRASRYSRRLEKSTTVKKFRKPFPSVAIELNKLNHAEIASHMVRAKQQSLSQTQSQTQSTQVSSGSESFKSSSSMSNYHSRNHVQKPSLQQSGSQTIPSSASSVDTEPPPICNGTHSFSTAASSSPGVAQRRAKVKSKKEKRDVGVMTDLSFGTDVINNLVPSAEKSPISLPLQNGRQDQHSPPMLRKGFTDKCTSPLIPKLSFRNGLGSINGLSLQNGYPDLGEIELKVAMNRLPYSAQILKTPRMEEPESSTREMEATSEASEGEEYSDVSSGDQGLVVSIPQSILNPSRTSSCSSISSDCLGSARRGLYRGPRRSEIQLLLDGDKPPSQRISAVDIPVFVAEDVSSRTTRSAAQTKGPWLSSTRKITPTESFSYSLSPSSPKKTTSDLPVENRKRTISESDSFCSPPPSKQPRIEADVPQSSQVPPQQTHQAQSLPPLSQHAQIPPQQSQQPPPPPQTQQPPQQPHKLPPAAPATITAVTNNAESHEKTTRTQAPTPPPMEEAVVVEQSNLDRSSTEEVFSAELVVFDSRGSCLLNNGEYSILMQGCPKRKGDPPTPVTFAPLTWNSVFCADSQDVSQERESHNIMLQFSLSWSDGPPQHRLITELDTALDLQKLRDAYFPKTPSPPPSPSLSPIPPPLSPPPSVSIEPEPMAEGEISSSNASTQEQEEQLPVPSLASKITAVPSNPPHPSLHKRIIFNFLYNNNSLQQTESWEDFHCPWCFLACRRLYNLLKHMSLCHPRFFFTYSPMEGGTVIDVHVNKLYDAGTSSIDRDPGERSNLTLVQRRKGPFKRLPHTTVLVERHAEVDEEDLSEFLNDGSWKRGYNINRMYFHSRSCLPMLGDELDMDSEVEGDTLAWQKICSQKMIEEFTDVNQGEKEVMKLWNLFALENGLIADKQIPTACVKFAQEKRGVILGKGISRNFMTHLIALCDFGLISPSVIRSSMDIVLGAS